MTCISLCIGDNVSKKFYMVWKAISLYNEENTTISWIWSFDIDWRISTQFLDLSNWKSLACKTNNGWCD
jgi:hypothetical protein